MLLAKPLGLLLAMQPVEPPELLPAELPDLQFVEQFVELLDL